MNKIINKYNLEPVHDGRKSFYGKAVVEFDGTAYRLISYSTHVATVRPELGIAEVYGTYSVTTLRHIKEFLKQQGFKAETKAQILEDYGTIGAL